MAATVGLNNLFIPRKWSFDIKEERANIYSYHPVIMKNQRIYYLRENTSLVSFMQKKKKTKTEY